MNVIYLSLKFFSFSMLLCVYWFFIRKLLVILRLLVCWIRLIGKFNSIVSILWLIATLWRWRLLSTIRLLILNRTFTIHALLTSLDLRFIDIFFKHTYFVLPHSEFFFKLFLLILLFSHFLKEICFVREHKCILECLCYQLDSIWLFSYFHIYKLLQCYGLMLGKAIQFDHLLVEIK